MITRIAWTAIIVLVLGSPVAAGERAIWIDTDPACTIGSTHDVDDCWAIIAALRADNLRVIGLSTVFGNTEVKKATATAQALLNMVAFHESGRLVPPVLEGASQPIRRQREIPSAVNELARSLKAQRLTILALGPLTNIAMLLQEQPDLSSQIEAIVAVAGQQPDQVFRVGNTPLMHLHDLNVRKDPEALEIVLHSGIPIHLIPFEAAQQVIVTRADLHTLEQREGLDAWLASLSGSWLEFWESVLGAPGFFPFDALAVAYLVTPGEFTCHEISAKMIRRRGFFFVRDTLEVSHSFEGSAMVHYCSDVSRSIRGSPITVLPPPSS
jgi:pyrimidine-specific ribonucleoside hydrolase